MPPVLYPAVALILALGVLPESGAAELRLGARFGDHMVIQRDRPIPVWGTGPAEASVEVNLGPRRATARSGADGHWLATLDPMPAGGPHTLSASVGEMKTDVKDVLIGDVWLVSGQSNMQMTLKECEDGPLAADSAARFASLRLATVGRKGSTKVETDADVRWRAAASESARDFSGVGFFFAMHLLADPALDGVPLGVIDSSFGGSTCESWIPQEVLAAFDPKDLRPSMFGTGVSGYYNAMIAPLGPAPIKGAVWYQGESNADRPETYPKLLAALVASWRAQFATPEMPFIAIQLPDWAAGSGGMSWAWIREAQAQGVRAIPHAALAVGIGTNDGLDLHPKPKAEISRRAARLALRDAYARPIAAEGPRFLRATAEGDTLRLAFDTAGDGLKLRDGTRDFAIAGDDGRYRYAQASVDGDSVILRNPDVPAPKSVRYAWSGVPAAALANRSGLPTAPFRTDALGPIDADVQPRPSPKHVHTKTYEVTVDGNGSVTSLAVGGRQFMANGLGLGGGTSVPGWFGPRGLADIREPGPGLISCADIDVTLLLEFAESAMTWNVTNRGNDGIKFRIALAPKIAVSGRESDGPKVLTRGTATITIDGVDTVADSEDGPILETAIPGRGTKRLILTIGGRE